MPIKEFTFSEKECANTLLDFIALKLDSSKKSAKRLLDKRLVFVNKRRIWIASHILKRGDKVEVIAEGIKASVFNKDATLYEDNYYLIVAKSPNILTNGPGSLEAMLKKRFDDNRIQAVHRLDKDTSGAVIFARSKEAFEHLKNLFKKNLVKKIYRVIVKGRLETPLFTINTPIRGQNAVTHVKVIKSSKYASYLEVNIETGRTHQIRVHLSSIGHPVVGETEYDRKPVEISRLRSVPRQMLHAYKVSFNNPYTLKLVSVTAKVPDDFSQCLRYCSL
ncbi:MAG TPA: RluA family pseudouridine synthase [Candidatus Wujingus californicus]|uniref:RluA family pseudouridine synthase n=1 Tax=Candidatus Wujingus californicus TaxID=3367618 RepID=UPI004029DD9E